MMERVAFVWVAFVMTVGCALISPTVRQSFNEGALDRASFEMQCPKEQVELVPLNRPLDDTLMVHTQVGVKGCGKQAMYIYANGRWVANSAAVSSNGGH